MQDMSESSECLLVVLLWRFTSAYSSTVHEDFSQAGIYKICSTLKKPPTTIAYEHVQIKDWPKVMRIYLFHVPVINNKSFL